MLLKSALLCLATVLPLGAMGISCYDPIDGVGGYKIGGDQPVLSTLRCSRSTDDFPYGEGSKCGYYWVIRRIMQDKDKAKGEITVPAGSPDKRCKNLGCDKDSVIYVCNDNDHDVTLKYKDIAYVVKQAADRCPKEVKPEDKLLMAGQFFTKDGWNVLLTTAECH